MELYGIETSNIFVDPNEKVVGVLGSGYLDSILRQKSTKKGACIASDRRLYFFGKGYETKKAFLGLVKTDKTVDLQDISGTSTSTHTNIWSIIIIVLLAAFVVFLAIKSMENEQLVPAFIFAVSFFLAGILFGLGVNYVRKKQMVMRCFMRLH